MVDAAAPASCWKTIDCTSAAKWVPSALATGGAGRRRRPVRRRRGHAPPAGAPPPPWCGGVASAGASQTPSASGASWRRTSRRWWRTSCTRMERDPAQSTLARRRIAVDDGSLPSPRRPGGPGRWRTWPAASAQLAGHGIGVLLCVAVVLDPLVTTHGLECRADRCAGPRAPARVGRAGRLACDSRTRAVTRPRGRADAGDRQPVAPQAPPRIGDTPATMAGPAEGASSRSYSNPHAAHRSTSSR